MTDWTWDHHRRHKHRVSYTVLLVKKEEVQKKKEKSMIIFIDFWMACTTHLLKLKGHQQTKPFLALILIKNTIINSYLTLTTLRGSKISKIIVFAVNVKMDMDSETGLSELFKCSTEWMAVLLITHPYVVYTGSLVSSVLLLKEQQPLEIVSP